MLTQRAAKVKRDEPLARRTGAKALVTPLRQASSRGKTFVAHNFVACAFRKHHLEW
jgi:hypothetical protein